MMEHMTQQSLSRVRLTGVSEAQLTLACPCYADPLLCRFCSLPAIFAAFPVPSRA